MEVKWTSFRYRPEFADPALEFAERSASTAPEQLCQADYARVSASLRQWCPTCQRATTSIECEMCGAESCVVCGDHGATPCEADDD